jgi:hypothetical protein
MTASVNSPRACSRALVAATVVALLAGPGYGGPDEAFEVHANSQYLGQGTSPKRLKQQAQAYSAMLSAAGVETLECAGDGLATLGKLYERHAKGFEAALSREPGYDPDQVRAFIEKIAGAADPAERDRLAADFAQTYGPIAASALAATAVDAPRVRDDLAIAFVIPHGAFEVQRGPVAYSVAAEDEETPPPPEESATLELRPGYPLSAQSAPRSGGYALANAGTGRIYADESLLVLAGSFRSSSLASVGASFRVPAGMRRVEATVSPAVAFFLRAHTLTGAGAAEVTLEIRVLDGTRVVARQRRTVARTSVLIAGFDTWTETHPIVAQCSFDRADVAADATYFVVVEIAALASFDGFAGNMRAVGDATVDPVRIALAR